MNSRTAEMSGRYPLRFSLKISPGSLGAEIMTIVAMTITTTTLLSLVASSSR